MHNKCDFEFYDFDKQINRDYRLILDCYKISNTTTLIATNKRKKRLLAINYLTYKNWSVFMKQSKIFKNSKIQKL